MTNNYLALQRMFLPMAERELKAQGLWQQGWRFKFNKNKTSLGICRYRTRSVEVSLYVCADGLKKVAQVFGHEVAHALTPGHGHDAVWRRVAISLGDTGERCGEMKVTHSVIGHCPQCNKRFLRHKMPRSKRLGCTTCLKYGGHYFDNVVIIWTRTR